MTTRTVEDLNMDGTRRVPHPFSIIQPSLWQRLARPSVAGCVSGVVLSALPANSLPELPGLPTGLANSLPATLTHSLTQSLTEGLKQHQIGEDVARRIAVGMSGFVLGYASWTVLDWLRLRAVKRLLTYTAWVTNPRSTTTKVWGLLLGLLRGRPPFSTFEFQALLSKQPLPSLDSTLDRYLSVARTLLDDDNYERTCELVADFRKNQGPALHRHLQEKAARENSWIYDYWLNIAYLSSRSPLPINSNYFMTIPTTSSTGVSQAARAASVTYQLARFESMLSKEQLSPVFIQGLVPLCMHGFRYLFNSNRIPGDYIDDLMRHPGNRHIIVISKGQYFRLDVYGQPKEDWTRGQLSPEELHQQFLNILDATQNDSNENSPPISALTALPRSKWAQQRRKLAECNAQTLKEIDTAMFVVTLEPDSPKSRDDYMWQMLTGDGYNRWYDKCFTLSVYTDGHAGFNFEHTPLDGMVTTVLLEFVTMFDAYEGREALSSASTKNLPAPKRLEWDTRAMETELAAAMEANKTLMNSIDTHSQTMPYGKRYIKKQRISPDGYFQMAMQLAFYRMHKHLPKTYEPGTCRLFLYGRTETVHPCSAESNRWVQMMDDPTASAQEKIELLRKAVKVQNQYRLTATVGEGCDRHMIAMLCASRELGMDLPALFTDTAFAMPFQLSTSQAPNMFVEYGCRINLDLAMGGFGPTDAAGYGVGYCVFGEDVINVQISCWHTCPSTDARQFGNHIAGALESMKQLFN